ncbi:DUF1440 domain-containing protein [Utexia brackfieldae]
MINLFQRTKPSTRCYSLAVLIGIIGGIISAFVKSGTEELMPPRLPGAIPPPVDLLKQMGIDVTNMVYTYSEQVVNYGGNGVHIIFSIVCAVFYGVVAEIFPKIKLWQGCLFGLIVAIGFHGIVLPVLQLTPPAWQLPVDGLLSEFLGTLLWVWVIEIVRRDLRSRFTKKPDPEFQ